MIDLLEALQPELDMPESDWPVRRRRRWLGLSAHPHWQTSLLLQAVLALCALGGGMVFVAATYALGAHL